MRIRNVVPFAIRGPRAALIALFLLSLGPPILYYRAVLPALNAAQMSADMLPGPYHLLRIFGLLSLLASGFFAIAVAVAYWRPHVSQPLFTRCTIFVLLFDTFYLCLALIVIATLLGPHQT
jgi:hypothetical protein